MRPAALAKLGLLATLALGVLAARGRAADGPKIALHFRDAEITSVVEAIAHATGQGFLFDEQLRGRVTITAPERVSFEEGLAVLDAALRMKGFVAIPTPGGPRRIVPVGHVTAEAPLLRGEPRPRFERAVTTLFRLEFARASEVAGILEGLTGINDRVAVFERTNSLILASSEARIHRLLAVARTLDRFADRRFSLFRLRYRPAEEAAELVREAFDLSGDHPRQARLWSDERANTLLVEGLPAEVDEIRGFLREIDLPQVGAGGLHVVRVRNADPETLAETLRTTASAPASARPGEAATPIFEEDYAIVVEPATRSLVIRANARTFEWLRDLIAELDVLPPLVSVNAELIELQNPESFDLQVDLLIPIGRPTEPGDTVSLVRTATGPTGSLLDPPQVGDDSLVFRIAEDPRQIEGTDRSVPGFVAQLLADQQQIQTRLLLAPQLVAASGDEHEIFVGNNVPILSARTAEGAAARDPLQIATNVERQDVGTLLRVRPTVGQAGNVTLELEVELSQVGPSLAGDPEEVGVSLRQVELTSRVELRDGETLLIGMQDEPSRTFLESGVPFVKDIPFLGNLFKSVSEQIEERHLLIAVRPRILRSPEDLLVESIRRRLAFERSLRGHDAIAAVSDSPYAVLVSSAAAREDAERTVESLAATGVETEVVEWEWEGQPRFDVVQTGFEEYATAAAAAFRRHEEGFAAEVVALLPKRAQSSSAR